MKSSNVVKYIERVAVYIGVAIVIIYFIFPIAWQLYASFKPPKEVAAYPPVWLFTPTLENWRNMFFKYEMLHYLMNSIVVASGTTGLVLLLASFAGYALARFRFQGRESLALDFLSFRMFPPIIVVIPLFITFQWLALTNTYLGLILAHSTFNLPFTVWLLRGFFMEIPTEVEEAAMIDGCSRLSSFWRVILPLALPGLVASGIFCFILSWNEFMFAAVVTGYETRTIPVTAAGIYGHHMVEWGVLSAASVLMAIPTVIIAIYFQKYLIRIMTYGAIKR